MRYINRFTSETKFLIDPTIGDALRNWARERLGPDPNGRGPHHDQYGVVSIYFDTDAHDVYQRHGSYGRSKYRIRHYESDKSAFLERKLRTRLFLSKRRHASRLQRRRHLKLFLSPGGSIGARACVFGGRGNARS